MSMEYIRRTYGVPAKRGARVVYRGNPHAGKLTGTIVGSDRQYIRVRFDGNPKNWVCSYHPTWEMQYLPPNSTIDRPCKD